MPRGKSTFAVMDMIKTEENNKVNDYVGKRIDPVTPIENMYKKVVSGSKEIIDDVRVKGYGKQITSDEFAKNRKRIGEPQFGKIIKPINSYYKDRREVKPTINRKNFMSASKDIAGGLFVPAAIGVSSSHIANKLQDRRTNERLNELEENLKRNKKLR